MARNAWSMVRRPLPRGSYRHHEWRLSTPCVDFTSPVNMVFTCMIMQHIHNTVFFFLECFRKTAGDCQSKTSIFSTTCQLFIREGGKLSFRHLISYQF